MTAMIITSVLFMAAAIIIRGIFGRRISGKMLMVIWAAVFIKLLIPVNIPSSFSVMNYFSEKSETESIPPKTNTEINYTYNNSNNNSKSRTEYAPPIIKETENKNITPSTPIIPEKNKSKTDAADIIKTVYFGVTAMFEFFAAIAYIICAVRFSRLENISVPEKYREKNIRFKKSDMGTPAVFGIFRPVILIPENTDMSDSVTLKHIILHEKTHIRHLDPLWNFITLAVCCANWYDPLVWVCRALYLKDAEKWCDECVINYIGQENKKSYAQSLLACADSRSRALMLISGFGESDIKGRIRAMMNDRKFRRGASSVVLLLTVIAFAAFGTGRAVKAEMEDIGFVPYKNGSYRTQRLTGSDIFLSTPRSEPAQCYTQRFTGSGGEKADVSLILSRSYHGELLDNYYHFILEADSEDYTVENARAEIKAEGVSSYRILPDGIKTEENAFTYSTAFNEKTNDIELAITFENYNSAGLSVTVNYKLKKGNFTVGEYTMNIDFDPLDMGTSAGTYADDIDNINYYLMQSGFVMEIVNNRYEIKGCPDCLTDLVISFNDSMPYEYSAVVSREGDGREVKVRYFNPYKSFPFAFDVTGDGVNDLIIITNISGTGILENYIIVIDGEKICEIPLDCESAGQMIKEFVCSEEFAEKHPSNIFTNEDPHLTGSNLKFPYMGEDDFKYLDAPFLEGDNISIFGGMVFGCENERIKGSAAYVLKRGDSEFSDIFGADFDFVYKDGMLKPVNMLTEINDNGQTEENFLIYDYDEASPPELPEFSMALEGLGDYPREMISYARMEIKAMLDCSSSGKIPVINYKHNNNFSQRECKQLENIRVGNWSVKDEKFDETENRYELILTLDVIGSGSEFIPAGEGDYLLIYAPDEDRLFLPLRRVGEFDEKSLNKKRELPYGDLCTFYTAYFGNMFTDKITEDFSAPELKPDSDINELVFCAYIAASRGGGFKDNDNIPYDEFDGTLRKILGFSADAVKAKESRLYNAETDCIEIPGRGFGWLCCEIGEDIYSERDKTHTVTINYYKDDFYLVLSHTYRYTVGENGDGTYSMLKIEHLYTSDNPILGGCL